MVSGKSLPPPPPFVIDTSNFSSGDLQLFCESSKFIEKSRERRHSAGKSQMNSSIMKTREELFEVSEVDENEYLQIATSACRDIDKNVKNLSTDIEKLFQSFNENVSICGDSDDNQGPTRRDSAAEFLSDTYICNSSIRPGATSGMSSFATPERKYNRQPKSFSRSSISTKTSTPNELTTFQIVREQLKLNKVKMIMDKEKSLKSDPEYPTVSSVKARIEFFNKLSKKVSEERNILAAPKSKVLKQAFATHNSVKRDDMKAAPQEEVKQLPNFVKDRIKLFECITSENYQNDVQQSLMNNKVQPKKIQPPEVIPCNQSHQPVEESLVLKPKNHSESLVAKIRRYFEKGANQKSMLTPKHTKRVETPKKSITDFLVKPKVSNVPEAKNPPTISKCSTKLPDGKPSHQAPQNIAITNLPKTYDPFIESGKSLKKLGDIVSTIRNIREQGMTELSRELFEMFKQSLHAASIRLAEAKDCQPPQSTNIRNVGLATNATPERISTLPTDSPGKKVAKVKPNVPNLSTFPRILKVIPKCKDNVGLAGNRNVQPSKVHNLLANYDVLNETDLTYEKFVTALERHGNCKT